MKRLLLGGKFLKHRAHNRELLPEELQCVLLIKDRGEKHYKCENSVMNM